MANPRSFTHIIKQSLRGGVFFRKVFEPNYSCIGRRKRPKEYRENIAIRYKISNERSNAKYYAYLTYLLVTFKIVSSSLLSLFDS